MLAQVEGYTKVEEAFQIKNDEATKEQQAGESSKSVVKKNWVKLDHTPEPLSSTDELELLRLDNQEAPTEGYVESLPLGGSITTLLLMLQKYKCW